MAVGMSQGSMLLVGHGSGDAAFWEWHRSAWELVKLVKGAA